MKADDVIGYAFHNHFYSDRANAAIHTSEVRFSPLTFRLAELLPADWCRHVEHVLADAGRYPEDLGRVAEDASHS